ncbi:drug/metabolite transporter (DMT)-like permease [Pseudomonas sp. BP8]|nr:drug/metabolite transporter (DMT)-like permease [Pseudomonas sp. BP8]
MGLLAAVSWGVTDFLVGVNARVLGVRRSVFLGQLIGLFLMSVIVFLSASQFGRLLSAPPGALLFGLAAAISTVVGALFLAKAFAVGRTSIVAPLVTTYGVFTTFLSWMTGEYLSVWQLLGIVTCFFGVLLVTSKVDGGSGASKIKSGMSVIYSLLAAVCYGASFWVQGRFSLPAIGPINMLWLSYCVGVIFLWRETLDLFKSKISADFKVLGLLCGSSLSNLSGFAAFSLGATNGAVSVVTMISTLSGGIASVLGCIFYRDKLSMLQIVGIFFVLLGAVFIHFYG